MTKLEQAFLSVSCPLCKATSGKPCTMPNGKPYYRRDENRRKYSAFHQMRQKRAYVIYELHAAQHVQQVADERTERKSRRHPQFIDSTPVEGGGRVIHVDFTTQKKGA